MYRQYNRRSSHVQTNNKNPKPPINKQDGSGNIHNSAAAVHYQIQLHCPSISSTSRLDVSWMDKIKGVFTGKKPPPTAETPTATKTAAAGAADQSFTLLRFSDEMGKARKRGTLKQCIVERSSEATFSEAFGKQEAILRYLGGIDPTGENTLAKFMWAKEAQSKMQKLQEEGRGAKVDGIDTFGSCPVESGKERSD
ncbi:hypothetical protein AKJ16_DCAP07415 [Drosera capensis]